MIFVVPLLFQQSSSPLVFWRKDDHHAAPEACKQLQLVMECREKDVALEANKREMVKCFVESWETNFLLLSNFNNYNWLGSVIFRFRRHLILKEVWNSYVQVSFKSWRINLRRHTEILYLVQYVVSWSLSSDLDQLSQTLTSLLEPVVLLTAALHKQTHKHLTVTDESVNVNTNVDRVVLTIIQVSSSCVPSSL